MRSEKAPRNSASSSSSVPQPDWKRRATVAPLVVGLPAETDDDDVLERTAATANGTLEDPKNMKEEELLLETTTDVVDSGHDDE